MGKANAEVIDAAAIKDLQLSKLTLTSAMETANATAVVTISNVAPAAVGTATISKWLTLTDSAGTVYYIPMWT